MLGLTKESIFPLVQPEPGGEFPPCTSQVLPPCHMYLLPSPGKDFTIMDQETLMCIMRWTEDEQTPLEFVADNISEVVKLKFEIRMPMCTT